MAKTNLSNFSTNMFGDFKNAIAPMEKQSKLEALMVERGFDPKQYDRLRKEQQAYEMMQKAPRLHGGMVSGKALKQGIEFAKEHGLKLDKSATAGFYNRINVGARESKKKADAYYASFAPQEGKESEELAAYDQRSQIQKSSEALLQEQIARSAADRAARDAYLKSTEGDLAALRGYRQQFDDIASGKTSAAAKQYQQSRDDAFRQAMAMAASSRSGSGLAQRQGMHANAEQQARLAQGSALAAAQERLAALGAGGQLAEAGINAQQRAAGLVSGSEMGYGQMGQGSLNFLQGQTNTLNQEMLARQQMSQDMQMAIMNAEIQRRAQSMQLGGAIVGGAGSMMAAMSDARVKDAIDFEDGESELDSFMAALSEAEKKRLEDVAMKDKYASNTRGMRGLGASSRSLEDEELYNILKRDLPHEARQQEQGVRPVEALSGEEKEDLKDQEDGDGFFAAMKGLFKKRKSDADQAAASASGKELKKATKALGQGAAMMGRANQANGYTPMVGRAPARSQGGWQSSMDAIRAQLGGGGPGRSSGRVSGPIGGSVMPFSFSDRESKMKAHMLDDMMAKTKPYSFEYNEKGRLLQKALGNNPEGRQYGVMAQDLERSPVGRSMVIDTPEGKIVDTNKAAMASLAANARLSERVGGLEDALRRDAKSVVRPSEEQDMRRSEEDQQLAQLGPNIEQGLRDAFFEAMQDLDRHRGKRKTR